MNDDCDQCGKDTGHEMNSKQSLYLHDPDDYNEDTNKFGIIGPLCDNCFDELKELFSSGDL